ncbi:MAG: ABC transporter permease [Pyrinomonadaceae bacterium]|nr:ABC transporter permease [Pyrinomonadaceae bacterium]
MKGLWRDVRYAARMLVKSPVFTLVAVLSLALGIGANASIFTLLDTTLLRPLPVESPRDLFFVVSDGSFSHPNFRDFRDHSGDVLAGLAAYRYAPMSFSSGGANERLWGYLVSDNYFDVLGVRAAAGRTFAPEEGRTPGTHAVAVVGHNFWQRRFNSDPQLVGKTISLNKREFTVVGIAPEEFNGTDRVFAPDVWVPLAMQREIEPGNDYLEARGDGRLFVFGRLKSGKSVEGAGAALSVVAQNLAREYPFPDNEGTKIELVPLGIIPMLRKGTIAFAGVMMSVVLLVLLLACTNLANLLLARATERRKEIAIRLALGASRARLVRQLLTESVMLSLAGGALGLLLALWINDLAAAFKPPIDFSILFDLGIDLRVFGFTLLLSVVTGIVFGIVPALQATKPDLVPSLKDETPLAGFRRSHLRSALIVGQMALSLLLLICAGLVLRSLRQAHTIDPGFQPEQLVAMSVDVGLQGYDKQRGREFYQRLTGRVAALPEVESVTLATKMPLSLSHSTTSVFREGQVLAPGEEPTDVYYAQVGTQYFSTLQIPLVAGREFDVRDDEGAPRVCVINETLARQLFPNEAAVGKRISYGDGDGPYTEVVGVAKDGKYVTLGERPHAFIYQPLRQQYNNHVTVFTRTRTPPSAAVPAIRSVMQSLDATLPIYDVKTLTEHMGLSLLPARAAAVLLGSFGVLALLLAALGLYGVISYMVAGRTREIGIRMALGAQARDVLWLIVRQGVRLALVGVCLGLAASLAATRFLSSLLYGVSASDPLTFGGIALLLVAVALLASYIPARRATKVDPMVALRYE